MNVLTMTMTMLKTLLTWLTVLLSITMQATILANTFLHLMRNIVSKIVLISGKLMLSSGEVQILGGPGGDCHEVVQNIKSMVQVMNKPVWRGCLLTSKGLCKRPVCCRIKTEEYYNVKSSLWHKNKKECHLEHLRNKYISPFVWTLKHKITEPLEYKCSAMPQLPSMLEVCRRTTSFIITQYSTVNCTEPVHALCQSVAACQKQNLSVDNIIKIHSSFKKCINIHPGYLEYIFV